MMSPCIRYGVVKLRNNIKCILVLVIIKIHWCRYELLPSASYRGDGRGTMGKKQVDTVRDVNKLF
jgi:hypothetical protein